MATQSQHFAIDDHSMETRIRLLEQLYEPLRVSRTTAPRVTRTDSTGWHHLMCLNRFDGISAAVVEPYFPIAPTHPGRKQRALRRHAPYIQASGYPHRYCEYLALLHRIGGRVKTSQGLVESAAARHSSPFLRNRSFEFNS